jgi:hypothetical protein
MGYIEWVECFGYDGVGEMGVTSVFEMAGGWVVVVGRSKRSSVELP